MQDVSTILRRCANAHQGLLEQTKLDALDARNHPDWPWIGMVSSAATRGSASRWEKNVKPRYEEVFAWKVVSDLDGAERRATFETVGRFRTPTAKWLESVYQGFTAEGGPAKVRDRLLTLEAESVIAFWTSFEGVGPKYARNIMMDAYDERFRVGYFAIDSRIQNILPKLGYTGTTKYDDQESFLNDLARGASIESWELDRLLFHAGRCVLAELAWASREQNLQPW